MPLRSPGLLHLWLCSQWKIIFKEWNHAKFVSATQANCSLSLNQNSDRLLWLLANSVLYCRQLWAAQRERNISPVWGPARQEHVSINGSMGSPHVWIWERTVYARMEPFFTGQIKPCASQSENVVRTQVQSDCPGIQPSYMYNIFYMLEMYAEGNWSKLAQELERKRICNLVWIRIELELKLGYLVMMVLNIYLCVC